MKKWEYYWVKEVETDSLGITLDEQGEAGWELVSVVTGPAQDEKNKGKIVYTAFMKRPKEQQSHLQEVESEGLESR